MPKPIQDNYQLPRFSPLSLPEESGIIRVVDWMVEKELLERTYNYEELVTNKFVSN
ncbi:hypothetical protein GGQ84_001945 [Desulfitispora alkaliphila]|uniref:hypothetical protein n=1 Tax=Desulfitispora alkaliphila TaxID=622674 RepID=UPI003D24DE3B